MNGKFYFYVCDNEYERGKYNGFSSAKDNDIVEDRWEGVSFKYCLDAEDEIRVIVVNGRQMESKREAATLFRSAFEQLKSGITKYFDELTKIAMFVFSKNKLGDWHPDHVVVITHWGSSPVERKERVVTKAVAGISDERFRSWSAISSSSIRKKAFPEGYNPFLPNQGFSNGFLSANLPDARICEQLERKLPSASEIKWGEIEKVSELELKEYYDRLMRKLNH